ncbi:RING finger and transmembrane domain-containing protein 2 [Coccinella septempunctata]|uniref:RING finger and transmembrane domain-containing protein 2 n=1 Tax=Coccinella septempunctata TaxID=41139 RepID=UPI001D0760CB|nr:RING finger and transmembrane domain-containing protein 2 [Coccinella septempunctata]
MASNDRSSSSPNFHNLADMPSSSQTRHSLPAMSASESFQRTVESARYFRENINNVIREIQPLVETARSVNAGVQSISFTSLLNRPSSSSSDSNILRQHSAPAETNSSFVVNIDGPDIPNEAHTHNNSNNNVNDASEDTNNASEGENLQTVVEAQQMLQVILKYIPFILILLAKGIYDYHEGIFIILIMLITFANANSTVRREATKRHRRSISSLGVALLYIAACLLFIHFIFDDEFHKFNDVLNLALIRTFQHPLTVWNLMWIVVVTDFVLKLLTIVIKILFSMLPGRILGFQKRGKIYLFIEAFSQMYRSMATIQPWLYYLLESYSGPEKIVAVFLSAFYMISKGPDLMGRLKLFKTACFKLLQNVTVGSAPSKEQIQTAGDHCPICHDQYDAPVLLECRHIFCENCVTTWFDREQTCPLCRAKIVDDPSWRDGSTSFFVQIF